MLYDCAEYFTLTPLIHGSELKSLPYMSDQTWLKVNNTILQMCP